MALPGDSLEMITTSDTTREQVVLKADGQVFSILISPHGAVTKEMLEEATVTALAESTQCECTDFPFFFFQVALEVAVDQLERASQNEGALRFSMLKTTRQDRHICSCPQTVKDR